MNSINKKSIYAVVAIVAVYLLAFRIAQPDTDLRGGIGVIALSLLVLLPATSLVLTVLGLREIHTSRKANGASRAGNTAQHYWPAIGALLFTFSFIVPFGFYGIARWRHNTTAQESSTSPAWTDAAEGATAALDHVEAEFVKGNGPARERADVWSGAVVGREPRSAVPVRAHFA